MMYQEFYERTKIDLDEDEYKYVEQSYYEQKADKDEFCKQWKKDYKDGHWETEYRLRRHLDQQAQEYEKKIADLNDNLEWYRGQYKNLEGMRDKMTEISERTQEFEDDLRRDITMALDASWKIWSFDDHGNRTK